MLPIVETLYHTVLNFRRFHISDWTSADRFLVFRGRGAVKNILETNP